MGRFLDAGNTLLRLAAELRGAQSVEQLVGGHLLHYYRVPGSGSLPPVVLLHGLGGSANGFARTFSQLAKHYRAVWAPDLPGNGFSPAPAHGALSLQEQQAVTEAFLQDVVGQPVFLVGNSLGGALSMAIASQKPKLVHSLGLVSPAGARMSEARMKALLALFDVKTLKDSREMTRRLFHRAPPLFLLFAGELRSLYGSDAVRSTVASIRPEDALAPEVLANLSMPTLLLWGKSEKLLPYESIDYYRAHLPKHAEVHEVDRFGHVPQMEHPKALVRRLVDFSLRHAR
ncbi:MAG: alpha/beta fold hydrolase [Myxococcaceae bacterium]|nr:alpha/beta fold hydrolase [Myxococcaceae bacterium]